MAMEDGLIVLDFAPVDFWIEVGPIIRSEAQASKVEPVLVQCSNLNSN